MFGRKPKASKTVKVHVPMVPVEFSDDDKASLKAILRSPLLDKLNKQVGYALVCHWLNKGCSQDFKDGWLACTSAFQNPPLNIAGAPQADEFCAMDIQED